MGDVSLVSPPTNPNPWIFKVTQDFMASTALHDLTGTEVLALQCGLNSCQKSRGSGMIMTPERAVEARGSQASERPSLINEIDRA